MADRGTVFMDEVGEMSLRMQVILLRFLETGEIQRVGSDRPQRPLDVRIITATNRNLHDRVATKEFREDLYYRLNVVQLAIPPLRERRDDIPALVTHFLQVYSEAARRDALHVSAEAMARLVAYDWRGNVRELRNVVERLLVRIAEGVIRPEHLPAEIIEEYTAAAHSNLHASRSAAVDSMYERVTTGRESFWSVVYEPFTAHDMRRDEVRAIVQRGLQETRGSYKMLMSLFNMSEHDYKRFLNFLRKHQCHMPFQRFRAGPQPAAQAVAAARGM
jgi:DNA-binding NtrC family response regulator